MPGQSRRRWKWSFSPGDEQDRIAWQAFEVGNRPTTQTRWVPLADATVYSLQGATLKQQSDGSMLVTKPASAADVYVVAGRTQLPRITALPARGAAAALRCREAARAPFGDGSFVLSRFQAATAPPMPRRSLGRRVRIELPGSNRPPLALAEVEVFSGGENVARRGVASQSSTQGEAAAKLAIDGNTAGDAKSGSMSCTADGADNPWWEVDLGEAKPIDRIVIFNRTDAGAEKLRDFRISVSGGDGTIVWQKDVAEPPMPVAEFRLAPCSDVAFAEVATDRRRRQQQRQQDFSPVQAIVNPDVRKKGWSASSQVHAAARRRVHARAAC